MKNNVRKEQLKKLALKKSDNGGRIYQLINKNILDKAIELITDEKTPTIITSLVKKGYLTGNEQFIDMLNNFIYYFDSKFPTICHKDLMLEFILENQVPEFLLCKKYWGDNNNMQYFINSMDKAIVNNFYETILFIDDRVLFKPFIKNLQSIDLDNNDDLESIMKFLKSLLWTNINNFSTLYLFQNFHLNLKKFQRKNKDKNPLEVYYHVINEMKIHYEMLIDSYYKNKGILKYVK